MRFVSAATGEAVEVEAGPGSRLLDIAHLMDQPLEGTCEGAMACSTCHVIVSDTDYAKLPAPSEEEEDMLDFAYGVRRTSRLACQVWLTDSLDSLEVVVPAKSYNMLSR